MINFKNNSVNSLKEYWAQRNKKKWKGSQIHVSVKEYKRVTQRNPSDELRMQRMERNQKFCDARIKKKGDLIINIWEYVIKLFYEKTKIFSSRFSVFFVK